MKHDPKANGPVEVALRLAVAAAADGGPGRAAVAVVVGAGKEQARLSDTNYTFLRSLFHTTALRSRQSCVGLFVLVPSLSFGDAWAIEHSDQGYPQASPYSRKAWSDGGNYGRSTPRARRYATADGPETTKNGKD